MSFSQTIQGKYGVKSYQDTKNTYDWIVKSIRKIDSSSVETSINFQFHIGKISCTCDTLEKFVENAYGVPDYSLVAMSVSYKGDVVDVYLSMNPNEDIYISAHSKTILEKVIQSLNDTVLYESEVNEPISVIYIENQDNSVTVNGNSNTIANNNSSISGEQEKSESKTSNWIQGICQGILANLMWWILGVVAVALLAWAISNGYISG